MNKNSNILKEVTAKKHSELDQHPILKRIMRRDVELFDYYLFLHVHYHANVVLEEHYKFACENFNFSFQSKVKLLENDLNTIYNHYALNKIELKVEKVKISDYLGLVYVIEGARQGNYYIKKHLAKKLEGENISFHFLSHESEIDWDFLLKLVNNKDKNELNSIIHQANAIYDLYLSMAEKISSLFKSYS